MVFDGVGRLGRPVLGHGGRGIRQALYLRRVHRDSKNAFYEGFQLNGVKLGTPERWDRLFLVFAWAYYWLNVGG